MVLMCRTRGRVLAFACMVSLVLFGCGAEEPASPTAAAIDGGSPSAPPPDMEALLANADLQRGQTLYFQCRACHSLNEGGPHKVGPNLWGMFDRKAGLAPGFAYSDAVVNADIDWTPESLSGWLERPSEFLPGNRMVFIGVRDAQDRANLIAFLQQETGSAAP